MLTPSQERRRAKVEAGICTLCSEPAEPGHYLCKRHKEHREGAYRPGNNQAQADHYVNRYGKIEGQFVYFARSPIWWWPVGRRFVPVVKIGYSSNLISRMIRLGAEECKYLPGLPRNERELHARFEDLRIPLGKYREFYRLEEPLVSYIASLVAEEWKA
jgi:hypothetical protein